MPFDGDEIVCHRVIQVKREFMLTKGDNNYIFDREYDITNVIGKVKHIKFDGLPSAHSLLQ
ncbi:MAG: hypothetical protein KAX49_11130 [Halanaerobiales bacterium]|nr:hypothetical protein [Halanaerobiales bacterium]